MVSPGDLGLWLNQQVWLLVGVFTALLLTYVALCWSSFRRRRTLLRLREGVNEESFADYLAQFGFDRIISRATYEYLQQVQRVNFPILPSDTLDEDLGVDTDDLDQMLRDLSFTLHREYTPGLMYSPPVTVEDLLRVLHAAPRVTRVSAA